jgi:phosphate transport system substrate-binding protein
MKKIVFLSAILSICLTAASPAFAEHLTASGCSVSNMGYLTELAKEFEKKTGIKMFIRGGGSVVGLEDVKSGRVDFAASCRNKTAGDPEDMEFVQVAWDALVFIVHKSNPTDNITLEDVRAIYAGEIKNWKQLKGSDMPIKVFVSRPKKGLSGVESSTNEMILKGKKPAETPHTFSLASTGIVEQMVEKTPEGFATTGFASAQKREVKMLKTGGVSPTKENITNGRYPFKRPLFLVIPKNAKPDVKKFLGFALSREGQNFIGRQGIPSLRDIK